MSWLSFLEEHSNKSPQKVAIIDQRSNRSLTYSQLKEEVDTWTYYLKKAGLKKGERVVLAQQNCLEHLTLFFACARLGILFVPLNWRLSPGEQIEILKRVKPQLVFSFGPNSLLHHFNHINLQKKEIQNPHTKIEFEYPNNSDPLLMLFTSGTTGTPKGVLQQGEMLQQNIHHTIAGWNLDKSDITLVETPFFHTGGYNVLCLPLLFLGGTVILAEKFDPQNVLETIEKEKVSVYFGVPTMFKNIKDHPDFLKTNLSSIRFFVSGGAPCPESLIKYYQDFHLPFKQGFGLTEVGPNCFLLEEKDSIPKMGSIGKPMPHTKALLVDSNGLEVNQGEIGELLLKGPHICAGYYNEEDRFQAVLSNGYFRTGDLAKKDAEGFYTIVGRKKDMYVSGGENVYPAEVEKQLVQHPSIDEAVVVSIPCSQWGESGMAYIKSNKELIKEDVRVFLNPRLSRYKHPKLYKIIEEFPLLPNGKIDRHQLKSNALELI